MAPLMRVLEDYNLHELLALIIWSTYGILRLLALKILHLIYISSRFLDGLSSDATLVVDELRVSYEDSMGIQSTEQVSNVSEVPEPV